MRKLICFFAVLLSIAAAPFPTQEPFTIYVKHKKWIDYDKNRGFVLVSEIKSDMFGNGKVPEYMQLFFHGPQPIYVDAVADGKPIRVFGRTIRENLYNKDIKIIAYFREPPYRHKNKWQNYEIKVKVAYYGKDEKLISLFIYESNEINGVIGYSASEDSKCKITLAKGHPRIKEIRKQVKELAKKYGVTIIEWEEREGYDYLWKN